MQRLIKALKVFFSWEYQMKDLKSPVSLWVIPLGILMLLSGSFLKPQADGIMSYFGYDIQSNMLSFPWFAFAFSCLACIPPIALVYSNLYIPSISDRQRILSSIIMVLLLFPPLLFFGIINCNYIKHVGTRGIVRGMPWLSIFVLFWCLKETIINKTERKDISNPAPPDR